MVLLDVLDHANLKDRVALGGVLGRRMGGVKLEDSSKHEVKLRHKGIHESEHE